MERQAIDEEGPHSLGGAGSAFMGKGRPAPGRSSPEGEEACVVMVSAPLRRARRTNGAVGMVLSGLGGAVGGGVGIGVAGSVVGSGGLAAIPVALGLMACGVFGGERLTRMGYIRFYRWGSRAHEKAFHRIFTRVERDIRRDLVLLPRHGS